MLSFEEPIFETHIKSTSTTERQWEEQCYKNHLYLFKPPSDLLQMINRIVDRISYFLYQKKGQRHCYKSQLKTTELSYKLWLAVFTNLLLTAFLLLPSRRHIKHRFKQIRKNIRICHNLLSADFIYRILQDVIKCPKPPGSWEERSQSITLGFTFSHTTVCWS